MNQATLQEPGVELTPIAQGNYALKMAERTAATPADLVRYAMDSGADLDRLEKLMQLQIAWEQREAEKAYNRAFAKFKASGVKIIKGTTRKLGPLAGTKYAELFTVVNAITGALSENGLSASWQITRDEPKWIEVTCTLKHASGFSESVSMGGEPDIGGAKNTIQARASTIQYLERYTLKAITGLAEQDDDSDGNAVDDSGELDSWRATALEGLKALQARYQAEPPMKSFWSKHSVSLKDAAKQADAEGARQ